MSLRCAWTGSAIAPASNQVMTTPVTADLDHDPTNGVETAFVSFATGTDVNQGQNGVLRIVDSFCNELVSVDTASCPAGGSLDVVWRPPTSMGTATSRSSRSRSAAEAPSFRAEWWHSRCRAPRSKPT
jgi:hypothetical protein